MEGERKEVVMGQRRHFIKKGPFQALNGEAEK
jgi:hypothetical protein